MTENAREASRSPPIVPAGKAGVFHTLLHSIITLALKAFANVLVLNIVFRIV